MNRIIQACLFVAVMLAGAGVHAQVPADAVWIDVRTPAEYSQGHLEQAQLIPFDGIEAGVERLGLAKDTPIYLYCVGGGRAEKARQTLIYEGYSNVTNAGGLEDARRLAAEAQP